MRLVKLSANRPGFKTVIFNKTGISLIVAEKEDKNARYDDRSCNGVGKSLLVEIIHFCLGANSIKLFCESLSDWEFSLEFEINGQDFLSRRNTSRHNVIILNGETHTTKEFNIVMGALIFDLSEASQNLSFRALFPRFMRRNKQDYNDPRKTTGDKEDYTILLRNLFLLGIDIDLVVNKYNLRTQKKQLDDLSKNFKADQYIRDFYLGNKDVSLQVAYLEDQINVLNSNLAEFKIAEDYYQIEQEANLINKELGSIKNRKVIIENTLHNIEKSIEIKADISKEKILAVYKELVSVFKIEALKKLEEVEHFHEQLITNRISRLSREKIKLKQELKKIDENITRLVNDLNNKLSYLSDKRALDQYAAVNKQRADLGAKLQKIKDYQILVKKIEDGILNIDQSLADESIKTKQYLEATEQEREKKFSLFSKLVKRVYPSALAGISLKNNTGDNKVRYNLDVRIEEDGSDGINSAKIFCYDLAVLLMECNHHMQFVWHDSRLFSDIDPRQRAILFKLANEYTKIHNKQYIATVNQDEIDAMRTELSQNEFTEIFDKSRVLTLKDDSPESKLLGIKIDMDYQ